MTRKPTPGVHQNFAEEPDMQDKAIVTEAYAAATIDDTGCEYLGRDVAQIEAIAKTNGNEVIYLITASLAQAEQPIGYITPDALKQLRMGIDCQPIHKDDRHGFTVPVYATPPTALSVEKAPAVETPPPVQHVEAPKPRAWLTKIYSNDGVLLDTRLDFVKPVIMSTAKTEFVPLFATTEGSDNG